MTDRAPLVLIVDDDANLCTTLGAILSAKGYAPTSFHRGQPAIAWAEREAPAVALIDLRLQDRPGLEVMAAVQDVSPRTECIVLTGHASQASAIEAVNLGAFAYFHKPYDMDQLLLAIRRAVDRHKAARALAESEEKYYSLFHQSVSGIYLHDLEGRILDANQVACSQSGYTLEELLQLTVFDLHPEGADTINQPREEILRQWNQWAPGQRVTLEAEHRRKDGTLFPVEISTGAIQYGGKKRILASVQDITERVQAESQREAALEALRDALAELTVIHENVPIAMLLVDRERRVRKVNGAAARFARRPAEEMLGLYGGEALRCLHHLDDPQGCGFGLSCAACPIRQAVLDTFADGQSRRDVEAWLPFPRNDGTEDRCLLVSTAYLRVDETERVLVCAQDATDRKKAESRREAALEALRANEARMRGIFRAAPVGIGAASRGILLDVNDRLCEITGYAREELVGQDVRTLFPTEQDGGPAGRETYLRVQEQIIATVETRFRHRDGQLIDVLLSSAVNPADLSAGITFTVLDITERVRAEAALKESERKYRVLTEISPAGVFRTDAGGRTTYVNDRWCEISGLPADEALGDGWLDAVHPDDRQWLIAGWHEAVATDALSTAEYRLLRPDGAVAWVMGQAAPEVDEEGRVVGYVGTITDLTERVQAESQREAALEALRASERALRRHSEEMAVLLNISQALNRLDLEAILHTIGERAKALFAADGSRLFMLEADGETLRCALALHQRAEKVLGIRIKVGQGVTGSVAARGEAEIVNDSLGDPRAMQVPGTPVEQEVMMFAPLQERGRLLGVLSVSRLGDERPFRPADLELLKALAAMASTAVANARSFEAERAARQQTERLLAATQALGATLDLQETFDRILGELRHVVPYDSASVQLLKGDRLEIIGSHGFPNLEALLGVSFDLAADDCPNVDVIRDRAPLILADASLAYDGFRREPHAQAGIHAWLGVPLLYGERIVGMLALDKREPGFFTAEHAFLAQAFAAQAAIAIENARLYQEARHHLRELALLNRIIAASAASGEIETILETVCRELAGYFDAPQAAAALLNEDETEAVVVAEYLAPGRPSALGEIIPVAGNPAMAHLLAHKTPLAVAEAQTDPRLAPVHDLMRRRGTASLLLVPLLIEGEVVGSLGVDTVEPRTPSTWRPGGRTSGQGFGVEEVDLARRVAEQVGGALARARLEETRQRLSTAVEQVAESIVITDTEGTILYVNPAFERITGYSRAEAIGQNPRLLKSDQQDEAFYRELWATIGAGQVWQGRLTNRRKDGGLYILDMIITPVRNPAGKLVAYVATMRDVTRELQLEEQFRQAQKMEAIGRLAGGIAHDFNNLLTVIHLSTRLLERKLRPEDPLWQHVQRIQNAGQRAANLIKQLLAFSRRGIVEPEVLSLNQVLGDLDRMLQRLIGEDIDMRLRLADDLWPVEIDPTQVEQVVINLAVNARDAMPTGGRLTLETANVVLDAAYADRRLGVEPGEYVLLAVSDTGVGMDKDVQEHLFEPFFTTKERGKGTGLGLATVFGIVKQNRGHIAVYSEVGQGTTFKIYLPKVKAETEAKVKAKAKAKAKDPTSTSTSTSTILVVEDEAEVRKLMRDILLDQGYRVLTARDGLEALQVAEAHEGPIHLLLTDVIMPYMSGRELADRLRPRQPEMRVLYISGYTDDAIVHHGVLDEDTAFLAKPFEVEALARKVREVLDSNL